MALTQEQRDTLAAVAQARLDRMTPEERVAFDASVVQAQADAKVWAAKSMEERHAQDLLRRQAEVNAEVDALTAEKPELMAAAAEAIAVKPVVIGKVVS